MIISPGTTDQSVRFTAFDDAGEPVVLTAASAALTIAYRRLLKGRQVGIAALAPITDLTFITSPHSDGGLLHYSDGEHRLDLPDAAFAAGADEVRIYVTATEITGGVVHGPIWLQAERASQASLDDVAAGVAALSGSLSGGVAYAGPVRPGGRITITRGFDWSGITLTEESVGAWPAAMLTADSYSVYLRHATDDEVIDFTVDATLNAPDGEGLRSFTFTIDQSDPPADGAYTYHVYGTTGAEDVEVIKGTLRAERGRIIA